jgi:hypothetical protein
VQLHLHFNIKQRLSIWFRLVLSQQRHARSIIQLNTPNHEKVFWPVKRPALTISSTEIIRHMFSVSRTRDLKCSIV